MEQEKVRSSNLYTGCMEQIVAVCFGRIKRFKYPIQVKQEKQELGWSFSTFLSLMHLLSRKI